MMPDKPIVVNSVSEEYKYISRQHCECDGTFKVVRQSFKPMPFEQDTIFVKCEQCFKKRKFIFDVSGFFNRQGKDILFKKSNNDK